MLRRLLPRTLSFSPSKSRTSLFSAGAHDQHLHPQGPYDAPHHVSYPDKAFAFGVGPDYKLGDWEIHTVLTYLACLYFCFSGEKKTTLKEWAKQEALARNEAISNGETVEFGKYFSGKHQFEELD